MIVQKVVVGRSGVMLPDDAKAYAQMRALYAPFYAKLDDEAKRALNQYSSGKSWAYNEHMRTTKGRPVGEHKEFDDALRRALDCTLPHDVSLYRGYSDQRVFDLENVTATIVKHQPLSATLSSAVAIDFGTHGVDIYMAKIVAQRGVKFGIPLHDFESEFLFKQDTVFKAQAAETVDHGARTFHVASLRAIRTLR